MQTPMRIRLDHAHGRVIVWRGNRSYLRTRQAKPPVCQGTSGVQRGVGLSSRAPLITGRDVGHSSVEFSAVCGRSEGCGPQSRCDCSGRRDAVRRQLRPPVGGRTCSGSTHRYPPSPAPSRRSSGSESRLLACCCRVGVELESRDPTVSKRSTIPSSLSPSAERSPDPRFTIAIPTFNRANWLEGCVTSALSPDGRVFRGRRIGQRVG